MDKFQETMQKLQSMTPKDKSKQMQKMQSFCGCLGCASSKGTGEKALVFCMTGKSAKINNEKGCICPVCPNTKQNGLTHTTFCTKGSEADLRSTKA